MTPEIDAWKAKVLMLADALNDNPNLAYEVLREILPAHVIAHEKYDLSSPAGVAEQWFYHQTEVISVHMMTRAREELVSMTGREFVADVNAAGGDLPKWWTEVARELNKGRTYAQAKRHARGVLK